jgi:DNA-binding transcriptional ArsR family regulator
LGNSWIRRNRLFICNCYEGRTREEPNRAIRNISRGFALSKGRNYIKKEDLSLLIKVVLSTASLDRVNIFDLLIAHKGTLTTSIITESLTISPPTAYKTMVQLRAVGLVDMKDPESETEEKEITLKDEFAWFLGEEFSKLREGYISTDKTDEMKSEQYDDSSLKENLPPTTYDYNCYECARVNHGTLVYQTNSLSDYQKYWINSGHKGPCQPGISDLEKHGWEPQDKEWEI